MADSSASAYVEDVSDDETQKKTPKVSLTPVVTLPIDGVVPSDPETERLVKEEQERERIRELTNFGLDDIPAQIIKAEELSRDKQDYTASLHILAHAMKLTRAEYGEFSVEMSILNRDYGLVLFELGRLSANEFNGGDDDAAQQQQAQAAAPVSMHPADLADAAAIAKATREAEEAEAAAGATAAAAAAPAAAEAETPAAADAAAEGDAEGEAEAVPASEEAGSGAALSDLEICRENLWIGGFILEAHLRRLRGQPLLTTPDYRTRGQGTTAFVAAAEAAAAAAAAAGTVVPTDKLETDDGGEPVTAVLESGAIVPEPRAPWVLAKALPDFESHLADVYESLGTTSMELEAWDEALSSLERSREIRESWGSSLEETGARGLASSHNQLMMYYTHQMQPQRATKHAEAAANLLVYRCYKMAHRLLEADSTPEGFAAEQALTATLAETGYVLPTNASLDSLVAPPELGTKVLEGIERALNKTSPTLRQSARFRTQVGLIKELLQVRRELMERWETLQDEIKAGVTDNQGAQEVKKMVRETIGISSEGNSGANSTNGANAGFSNNPAAAAAAAAAAGGDAAAHAAAPVVLVAVSKKKRPVAPTAADATAAAPAAAAPAAAPAAESKTETAAVENEAVTQDAKRARTAGEDGAAAAEAAAAGADVSL